MNTSGRNMPFTKSDFYHWNIAHRGLHNSAKGIMENSLPAFQAAVDHGYGIELDVQLSADGQVVVFHDDTLLRLCGIDARVDHYTYDELQKFSLGRTDQKIPLFSQVLQILETGRGPLVCELKYGPRNEELCQKTYALLKASKVTYCIESFDPRIVRWFRDHAPEVFRGQLSSDYENLHQSQPAVLAWILSRCGLSFWNKPDFIAYRNVERPRHVLRLHQKGVMLVAWTSRVPDRDQRINDAVIFEGYEPQNTQY